MHRAADFAGRQFVQQGRNLFRIKNCHGLIVEGEDDIAGLDTGLVGRPVRNHGIHQHTLVVSGLFDGFEGKPAPASRNLAVLDQLSGHDLGNVGRDGESMSPPSNPPRALTPTTSPLRFTSGPPLFPGLMGASC